MDTIMNKKSFINEHSDEDSCTVDVCKIVIVYGTIFCICAYNIIHTLSSLLRAFPFDLNIKPGESIMTKLAVFDIVEIIIHIAVTVMCAVAFNAIFKKSRSSELFAISPLVLGFIGFTIKSVLYRSLFHTMYKMPWQNNLFIILTLALISINIFYFKKESIISLLSKL
jgi:hypothetical protein